MNTITRSQYRQTAQPATAAGAAAASGAASPAQPAAPGTATAQLPYCCAIAPNTAYDGTQDPGVGSQTTMRDLMRENIGEYVVCEHLVGTNGLVCKDGCLRRVEANAFVLEDPKTGSQTYCDYFSLKFFTVPGQEDVAVTTRRR